METYTLTLEGKEVDLIGVALGNLPYKEVALLITKLRQQVINQQMEQNQPVEEKPEQNVE